jgi:hypothetical protein
MKRREAIRNVILISAGAGYLYSCKEKAATISLKHIPLTRAEGELVSELSETIIPKTDFPGAKDLKTDEFILVMVDDVFSPEEQDKFKAGMKVFHDAGFVKMSADERKEFINKAEGDAKWFFAVIKQGTIENFTSSKEYLEKVKNVTTLIPPKFQACAPVNA